MAKPDDITHLDAVLLPFMRAGDTASETHLSDLVSRHSESTIKGIIRSQLRVSLSATDGSHDNQEALELLAEVQTDLVGGLRRLKRETASTTITNLRSYVAAVTFNACSQWLRRKYPKRLQLKNKIRYLLTHVPAFALWEADGHEWLCGFVEWRDAGKSRMTSRAGDQPRMPFPAGRPHNRDVFIELLTSLFRHAQAPVLIEDAVSMVAEALDIRDEAPRSDLAMDQIADTTGTRPSTPPRILTELEQRSELRSLWSAVCQLPLRHRSALLLNLRDKRGADALALLPVTGVATINDIAAALAFTPDDFARIWNDLPWDDLTIARHLGLTRQQIINLRQSARARLAREFKGF